LIWRYLFYQENYSFLPSCRMYRRRKWSWTDRIPDNKEFQNKLSLLLVEDAKVAPLVLALSFNSLGFESKLFVTIEFHKYIYQYWCFSNEIPVLQDRKLVIHAIFILCTASYLCLSSSARNRRNPKTNVSFI
jgi:hypothetical protein